MGGHVPAGAPVITPGFDDVLRQHAAARPDHVALIDATTRLTYAALDARIDATARRFLDAALGSGDRVVLVADNSVHHLVTALALWRAGATLVMTMNRPGATNARTAPGNQQISRPTIIVPTKKFSN